MSGSLVMDKYDALEEESALRGFPTLFGLSQAVGALAVILSAVWMGSYGGFAWQEDPDKQFHYHPLFMTIGLIFLYGEAILVYRVFRHEAKRFTKLLHIILHSMVAVFFVVALKAVFDSHNLKKDKEGNPTPLANLYTLHSWIGLSTVLLFCAQFVGGFVAFFWPGLSMPVRSWYLPIHTNAGLAIFVAAAASALMGIAERAAWHVFSSPACKENKACAEGVLSNFLGLSILVYVALVLFLVANPAYKRRPLPQEESLHQLTAD